MSEDGDVREDPDWHWIRAEVIVRDEYQCQAGGCEAVGGPDGDANLHVDHITPVEDGGTNDPDNLRTLCATCHARRHWNVNLDLDPESVEYEDRAAEITESTTLSQREAEVHVLKDHGLSHNQIKDLLNISKGAVDTYSRRINENLERAEATLRLLDVDE